MLTAFKNMAATLLASAQTRLSLLGNELQVQKIVLVQMLAFLLAAMFCAGLVVLLAVGTMLSLWWEQRVWVLGASTAIFSVLVVWCCVRLKALLSPSEPMFASSLAALQDDLAQLRAVAGQKQQPAEQTHRGQGGE